MSSKLIKIMLVIFVLLLTRFLFFAEEVFVRDILADQEKYYNLQVQLQGEVTSVESPPNPQTRGCYYLLDNSDKTIKIVANILPAPGKKFVVTGVVQVDTQTQKPFIREVSRVELGAITPREGVQPKKEGLSTTVIILIVLIVIVALALLVIIFRKPQPATPPAAVDVKGVDKTRQVDAQEVEREAGGLKTKQVPNILAQVEVSSGDMSGKSFPLGYETVLGRTSGDIVLEDASVSREHAKIVFAHEKYHVENLSDTNPVIVNGERVKAKKELKTGDEIILGVIKLKFKLV